MYVFINFHVAKFRLFIFRSHSGKVSKEKNGGGGVVEMRKVRAVAIELRAHQRDGCGGNVLTRAPGNNEQKRVL